MSTYVWISCSLKPLCRSDHGTPNRTFLTCRERFKIFCWFVLIIHLEISGKKVLLVSCLACVFMVSCCYCSVRVKVHFTFYIYVSMRDVWKWFGITSFAAILLSLGKYYTTNSSTHSLPRFIHLCHLLGSFHMGFIEPFFRGVAILFRDSFSRWILLTVQCILDDVMTV